MLRPSNLNVRVSLFVTSIPILASIPGVGAATFEPFSATGFRRRPPRLSHSEVLPAEESHLTLGKLYSIVWMFYLLFTSPTAP
jgi:hypothetical protein